MYIKAFAAVKADYNMYAVIDASGTWSPAAELASVMHLKQAGVIFTNWIAIAAELKHDEDRPTTPGDEQSVWRTSGTL